MSDNKTTIIAPYIREKILEVAQYGKDREYNGTRESLNQIMVIEFPIGSFRINVRERIACTTLYEKILRKNWDAKYDQEYHHYEFLKHALLHKINAVKYFHNEGLESRKLIIFSDDCISSIQLIVREEEVGLYVHMRSSDIINLLPLDLIALTSILNAVILTHDLKDTIVAYDKRVVIHVTFGSLHIYQKDMKIAKIAGVNSAGEKYQEERRHNI